MYDWSSPATRILRPLARQLAVPRWPATDYASISRRRPPRRWRSRARRLAVGLGAFTCFGFGFAHAVHGGPPARYESVTVAPGQTLWQIASERYPNADVRERVAAIETANGLAGPNLRAGQRLRVPTG